MKRKAILFSAGIYHSVNGLTISNLNEVIHDVEALKQRLEQIEYDVRVEENITKMGFFDAINAFAADSSTDTINIVFFSGHGGHSCGKNYIFPVDLGPLYKESNDINNAAINLEDIIHVFRDKGKLILILDMCRTDGLAISSGHYSEMTIDNDVYIAYATKFQETAMGTENGLSWFTEAICDEILSPNISVDELFTRVRQNVFHKHKVQIPTSVNALLSDVVLHSEQDIEDLDNKIYAFIKKYGSEYEEKHGYYHGDDMVFIDAAQYFDISLLDAIWKYKKVDNDVFKKKGVSVPELSEDETKIVSFLGLIKGKSFFTFDESHSWYYNGRLIRMGEIPPLPESMRQMLPEEGKEYHLRISAKKDKNSIVISINLPDYCEIFIWHNETICQKKYSVFNEEIIIRDAEKINKIVIDSNIYVDDPEKISILGCQARNVLGENIEYNPLSGNKIKCSFCF